MGPKDHFSTLECVSLIRVWPAWPQCSATVIPLLLTITATSYGVFTTYSSFNLHLSLYKLALMSPLYKGRNRGSARWKLPKIPQANVTLKMLGKASRVYTGIPRILSGIYLIETLVRRTITSMYEETGTKMFIVSLFIMVKTIKGNKLNIHQKRMASYWALYAQLSYRDNADSNSYFFIGLRIKWTCLLHKRCLAQGKRNACGRYDDYYITNCYGAIAMK